MAVGYTRIQWARLRDDLLRAATAGELVAEHVSEFGTKYVVDAVVQTPTGRMIGLRTVWIAHEADHRPRLVTAYPI